MQFESKGSKCCHEDPSDHYCSQTLKYQDSQHQKDVAGFQQL
jgi:hypothetical protein